MQQYVAVSARPSLERRRLAAEPRPRCLRPCTGQGRMMMPASQLVVHLEPAAAEASPAPAAGAPQAPAQGQGQGNTGLQLRRTGRFAASLEIWEDSSGGFPLIDLVQNQAPYVQVQRLKKNFCRLQNEMVWTVATSSIDILIFLLVWSNDGAPVVKLDDEYHHREQRTKIKIRDHHCCRREGDVTTGRLGDELLELSSSTSCRSLL